MNNHIPSPGRKQSYPEHDHLMPEEGCDGCLKRFGTVVATTAEIAKMLRSLGVDDDPLAATVIQLVWTVNRNLDRIATALENRGGAA